MPFLFALAAALLSPAQATEIRCVALLALVSTEQARGVGWSEYPPLARDGARFAGIVGEDVMNATGATREDVRDMIYAAARALKATPLDPPEVGRCVALMTTRAPAPATAPE
jgi:hypothetical protein